MTTLLLVAYAVSSATGAEPLKIHLISGSGEYKSEASLKALQKELEEKYSAKITASWVKDGAKELPDADSIPQADLLIVFARRLKLPPEQMAIIRKHWEAGKPVVGIRTASHAFENADNAVFDRQVLGGNYQGHFGGEPVKVVAAESAAKHPVLEGVGPFVSGKLYKAGPLAESAVLLQNGTIESKNETHAVTWVHEYNGGRMFYTSLGVPSDFQNDDFKRMIINAILWTTRRK
jgi:type 1 glutamine amidotransferase